MEMEIKFKDKKSYNTAFGFLESNGFCFRPRRDDRVIEFYYEYAIDEFVTMCNNLIGLESKFEVIK